MICSRKKLDFFFPIRFMEKRKKKSRANKLINLMSIIANDRPTYLCISSKRMTVYYTAIIWQIISFLLLTDSHSRETIEFNLISFNLTQFNVI